MGTEVDLWIYGPVGPGDGELSAENLRAELSKLSRPIDLIRIHIYSNGGDAGEALAIADLLRGHESKKEAIIEGICASAASLIAMAGDLIRIYDNSLIILHKPYASPTGNADELRSAATALDAVQQSMVATYKWKSWMSANDINGLINEGTWMGAEEARIKGFATEVIQSSPIGASLSRALDPQAFTRLGPTPRKHQAAVDAMLRVRQRNGLDTARPCRVEYNQIHSYPDYFAMRRKGR